MGEDFLAQMLRDRPDFRASMNACANVEQLRRAVPSADTRFERLRSCVGSMHGGLERIYSAPPAQRAAVSAEVLDQVRTAVCIPAGADAAQYASMCARLRLSLDTPQQIATTLSDTARFMQISGAAMTAAGIGALAVFPPAAPPLIAAGRASVVIGGLTAGVAMAADERLRTRPDLVYLAEDITRQLALDAERLHQQANAAGAGEAVTRVLDDADVRAALPLDHDRAPDSLREALPAPLRETLRRIQDEVAAGDGRDPAVSVGGELVRTLRESIAPPGDTLDEILRLQEALGAEPGDLAAQSRLHTLHAELEQRHADVDAAISIAGFLFDRLKIPDGATVLTIASAAHTIQRAVEQFRINPASALTSLASGVGAISTVLSLFGPDPSTLVLDAIQGLQEDIAQLRGEILEGFQALYQTQVTLLRRLDRVLDEVLQSRAAMLEQFSRVNAQLSMAHDDALAMARERAFERLHAALNAVKMHLRPAAPGLDATIAFDSAMSTVSDFGVSSARGVAFTWSGGMPAGSAAVTRLVAGVQTQSDLASLVGLVPIAALFAGEATPREPLVNPLIWAMSADRFVELWSYFPHLRRAGHALFAHDLIAAGEQFDRTIREMVTTRSLRQAGTNLLSASRDAFAPIAGTILRRLSSGPEAPWPGLTAGPLPPMALDAVRTQPIRGFKEPAPRERVDLVIQSSPAEGARTYWKQQMDWFNKARDLGLIELERVEGLDPIGWAASWDTPDHQPPGGINPATGELFDDEVRAAHRVESWNLRVRFAAGPFLGMTVGGQRDLLLLENPNSDGYLGVGYRLFESARICVQRPITVTLPVADYNAAASAGLAIERMGFVLTSPPPSPEPAPSSDDPVPVPVPAPTPAPVPAAPPVQTCMRIISTTRELFQFLWDAIDLYRDWLVGAAVESTLRDAANRGEFNRAEASAAVHAMLVSVATWLSVGDVCPVRPCDAWVSAASFCGLYRTAALGISTAPPGPFDEFVVERVQALLKADLERLVDAVAIPADAPPLRTIAVGVGALRAISADADA